MDDKEKIKEALELIRSFEPLEEWRGQEDPETSEDLVREIKKNLRKIVFQKCESPRIG